MQKIFSIFLILVLVSSFIPLSQYSSFATHAETGTGEIHGIKWDDADGNGIFDAGESVIAGVVINMINSDDTIQHETITDVNGEYWIMGLEPDTYTVSESLPAFTLQTYPIHNASHFITLNPGDIVQNINFGNLFVGPSEIHGTIFQDIINVGVFDAGDVGISNQFVFIQKFISTSTFPQFSAFTFTDLNGDYDFLNLEPGIYRVTTFAPFSPGVQTVPTNNQLQVVTLSGQIETGVNIGFDTSFGSITGTAFIDSNENGIKDVGELPAASNQICASPGNTCSFSNVNGDYTLNLPSGTYDIFSGAVTSIGFSTFTTINIPSLITNQVISNIDIPYRNLIPLPVDMEIPNSNGEINGVPILRGSLSIVKDITACVPVEAPLTTLTFSDGTMLTQTMQNIPATTLWTNDFGVVVGQSTVNIRVDIDCPPDTSGYPDNVANIGPEDIVQIGDLIFYDPSGQIINQCTNDPISDAITTLRVAAPQGTTNFVIPQTSAHLPSTNPQITDADGNYGWVTIPGDYTVTATKTGFESNTSPIVTIPPPVTGLDIFLTPVGGCAPELLIQNVIDDLQTIIDDNPGSFLADKLEDALNTLQIVIDELNKNLSDNQAAIGNIEGAIGDIDAAIGLVPAEDAALIDIMDDLAGNASQLAQDAIDEAIANSGDPDKISEAGDSLAEGDALLASDQFKDAASKYKDAVATAEGA